MLLQQALQLRRVFEQGLQGSRVGQQGLQAARCSAGQRAPALPAGLPGRMLLLSGLGWGGCCCPEACRLHVEVSIKIHVMLCMLWSPCWRCSRLRLDCCWCCLQRFTFTAVDVARSGETHPRVIPIGPVNA